MFGFLARGLWDLSSPTMYRTQASAWGAQSVNHWTTREVLLCFIPLIKVKMFFAQLCPTLHNPVDCSLPGSSVHGVLQAKILGWVFPFSGDLPNPGTEPQ